MYLQNRADADMEMPVILPRLAVPSIASYDSQQFSVICQQGLSGLDEIFYIHSKLQPNSSPVNAHLLHTGMFQRQPPGKQSIE